MTRRDRTVIAVVLAVAVVVAGWLLVVQPKRSQASKLATQISSAQSQLNTVRLQVAQDQAARATFSSSYTVLAKLGEAVPEDDNVPSLIFQIQSAASAAHVSFESLTLSGNSSSTSSAPGAASAAALPPGASIGPAGFPVEPFTFTFDGSFFHLADFFGRLQRFVEANNKNISVSGRLMTLDGISLGAGPSGFPSIAATVNATTFLLPASEGLTAGATPLGPGPQTVSTTTTSSSTTPPPAVVSAPVR